MTKSSINRILRQFGDKADINTVKVEGEITVVPNPLKAQKLTPIVFGFKAMPHTEKVAAKKAHRAALAKQAYADPRREGAIRNMVAYMKHVTRRNGVGRPPLFKRFLVSRSAA